jgi:hypothetical protein
MEQMVGQTKMEQMMEHLLAKMKANNEEVMKSRADTTLMMAKMESSQEEMKAAIRRGQEERIKALKGACREATNAWLGETKASPETTEAHEGRTEACLEKSQEVPKGATGEETIGATEDRSRDLRLAVGCRGPLKTRTRRDGRVRQKYAATVGRPTRRTVTAMRKGELRKAAFTPAQHCWQHVLTTHVVNKNAKKHL